MTHENAANIKELFEKKTGVSLTPARPAYRPARRAALAVAAVLCCLGFTAVAANHLTNGALIRFFQSGGASQAQPAPADAAEPLSQPEPSSRPEPLSEAQLLTIDRYTTEVGERQTVGGTTVTLETVTAAEAAHDVIVYCVLTVEAPDGAWTQAGNNALGFEWYYSDLSGETAPEGNLCWLQVQDDPQGRPNVKTVVTAFQIIQQDCSGATQLRVDLENFWIHGDHEEDCQYISEGLWKFEVPLDIQSGLSLAEEPVPLAGGAMELESLGLTPLGGSVVARGSIFGRDQWQPKQVIFSDGSCEPLYSHGGTLDGDTLRQWWGFTFAAPTDLTDAVAVEFADGTRIPLP